MKIPTSIIVGQSYLCMVDNNLQEPVEVKEYHGQKLFTVVSKLSNRKFMTTERCLRALGAS